MAKKRKICTKWLACTYVPDQRLSTELFTNASEHALPTQHFSDFLAFHKEFVFVDP